MWPYKRASGPEKFRCRPKAVLSLSQATDARTGSVSASRSKVRQLSSPASLVSYVWRLLLDVIHGVDRSVVSHDLKNELASHMHGLVAHGAHDVPVPKRPGHLVGRRLA